MTYYKTDIIFIIILILLIIGSIISLIICFSDLYNIVNRMLNDLTIKL
jgi:hypothetical protein